MEDADERLRDSVNAYLARNSPILEKIAPFGALDGLCICAGVSNQSGLFEKWLNVPTSMPKLWLSRTQPKLRALLAQGDTSALLAQGDAGLTTKLATSGSQAGKENVPVSNGQPKISPVPASTSHPGPAVNAPPTLKP